MNSYRCPQCGLLNWATTDQCKRCRLPNPANTEPQQFAQSPIMQNTMAAATPHTSVQMPFAETPNFQTPNHQMPPQFQQQRTGSYSNANIPHYSNNYQAQNSGNVNSEEIEKAEKNIRNGWVAGIVWASLLALATVAFMFLSTVISGNPGNSPANQNVAKTVEIISKTMVGVLAVMTLLIGGLSFGVRKKSMVSTVILIVITSLALLNSIIQVKLGPVIFAIVLLTCFGKAASGINTLKKNNLL